MTTETERFFDGLVEQHQPLLARTNGCLRFDVVDGDAVECWHVTIAKGNVVVSREQDDADAVVRLHKPLLEDITCGRANAMAAVIRGEVGVDGSPELLVVFQRMFPGPASSQSEAAS